MKVSTLDLSSGKKKSQQQMGKYEQPSSELEAASANGRSQTLLTTASTPGTLSDLTRYTKKPRLLSHP